MHPLSSARAHAGHALSPPRAFVCAIQGEREREREIATSVFEAFSRVGCCSIIRGFGLGSVEIVRMIFVFLVFLGDRCAAFYRSIVNLV